MNNVRRINICNVPIDVLTMEETIEKIDRSISEKKKLHHVVVNAAKLVKAQSDDELWRSIINSDLVNADGQAVVWASRFLGKPLPERVAGVDLMIKLVDLAAVRGYKIFLLGAREEIVEKVAGIYTAKYGEGLVAGYRNGYFSADQEESVAREIACSKADMLFVAMTSPAKEVFLNKYKHIIDVPFIMGVGGTFDVIAGKTKRAPGWMQRIGMEWFYRVIQEPGRMWKRYLYGNSAFIYLVMKEKLKRPFVKK